MRQNGFQFSQFLGEMVLPVSLTLLIGIPLAVCALRSGLRSGHRKTAINTLAGSTFALLAGFVSAGGWLSWNSTSGLADFLRSGAPNQFAPWQIIGCGITLIVFSGLVTAKFSEGLPTLSLFALLSGTGFAAAFALGVSFDVPTQEAIGVLFSFFGIGFVAFLSNLAVWNIRNNTETSGRGPGARKRSQ